MAEGFELGRLVSVRRIPGSFVTDQTRERLRKSVRACLDLRHPSLLKLLAIREVDSEVLSISEHLQGVSLLDLKRFLVETQTPMPPGVALRIVRDAARAGSSARGLANSLSAFYARRLLYNETIFVADFGETLLRDVGVITELADCPQFRENPQVVVGLSPEELSGPKVVQGSSEVFSLGVLLWELLTNRLVFSRRDGQRAVSSVISQPIAPLDRIERLGSTLPKELVQLVAKAIDRDPRRRIANLDDFADRIDDGLSTFIGTTDQVGNTLRRFASGFMGETEQSSRWSIGASSDSFSIDSERRQQRSSFEHDFEPETLSDRTRLERSLLELRKQSERERDDGTRMLDDALAVDPKRRYRPNLLGLGLLFVLATVVVAVLYRFVWRQF
jgi:serine/threonine-protein kinase